MTNEVLRDLCASLAKHLAPLMEAYNMTFTTGDIGQGGLFRYQIMASPSVQLRFLAEYDHSNLSFARADTLPAWEDDPGGTTAWFSLLSLAGYVDHLHPELAVRIPDNVNKLLSGVDRDIAGWAYLLEAYLPHLLPAFSGYPPGWWEGYHAWYEARLARYRADA